MGWMEFVLAIATLILGTGWLFTWRAHKRQENAKAKQEEATAKQGEADAFKSMQDAYQQTLDDVNKTLNEVRAERDHYKEDRNILRQENDEMRKKYLQLENKITTLSNEYKNEIARLGRRLDCISPFLCGVAGCMHRKKVSLMGDIDDNSFDTIEDRENVEQKKE